MIKTVIIDDDQSNITLVKNLISKYASDVEVLGEATNLVNGIEVIEACKPNLLFLDIELHNRLGFDILDVVSRKNMFVIVITAHEKYAVKAIKYEAVDFLLKPIQLDEFILTIKKIKNKISGGINSEKNYKEFLTVHGKNFIEIISFTKMIYLESENTYTHIVTQENKKLTSTRALGEIEEELPTIHFLRVHRSYIININEIKGFTRGKQPTLIMSNDIEIPIAQNKRKEIFEALGLN